MLHATLELARRVERAEIDFCALAGARGAHGRVASLDVGGGRALFSRSGSPLNKALGLGLEGPVSDQDLDRLESFYAVRQSPAQVELCPLAHADVARRLSERGFVLQGFENELGVALTSTASGSEPHDNPAVRVALATAEAAETWIHVTAEGFAAAESDPGAPPESYTVDQLVAMMRQFLHPSIRHYLAWVDGRPAGGVATWTHDRILGIFGASTLPAYRRRGVQTALTRFVLAEARDDAEVAIATTAPGSTSQRTHERLGFQVLYTRAILVKS
jgi:ribosomal protein S18 acetylase RimI-like enzyme